MAYIVAEAMLCRQGYALRSLSIAALACLFVQFQRSLLLNTYLRSGAFSGGGTWNTQK